MTPLQEDPIKIAIICHLERLWPQYDRDYAYFSLNLSTAYLEGTPIEIDLDTIKQQLFPWNWGITDSQIKISVGHYDGPNFVRGSDEEVKYLPYDAPDVSKFINPQKGSENSYVQSFQHLIGQQAQNWLDKKKKNQVNEDPFSWSAGSSSATEEKFSTVLGYFSTLPAPLPQLSYLSLCFKVSKSYIKKLKSDSNKELENKSLYVMPVFGQADNQDKNCPKQIDEENPISNWHYKTTLKTQGNIEVTAFFKPWKYKENETEDSNSFYDLNTYWLKKPSSDGQQVDWSITLADKLAEGFDLAQRLVDILRENQQELQKIDKGTWEDDVMKPYRDAIVACARDTANLGLRRGPDGGSIFETILNKCNVETPKNHPMYGALKQYETKFEKTEPENKDDKQLLGFEVWCNLLKSTFPELAATRALSASVADSKNLATSGPAALPDEVAELDMITSTLSREENLRKILVAQWEAAVQEYTDPPKVSNKEPVNAFWNTNKWKIINEILPSLSLRRRMAHSNIGDFWNSILPTLTTAETVKWESPNEGHLSEDDIQLKNKVANTLKQYFQARFHEDSTGEPTTDADADKRYPKCPIKFHKDILNIICGTSEEPQTKGKLREFAESFVTNDILQKNTTSSETSPTESAHPLVIQVDRVGTIANPGDNANDLLRRFSGVCVFMRPTYTGANGKTVLGSWRCLNMAQIYAKLGDDTAETLIHPCALVPSRLAYRDNMRQAFLTYDNHPLTAHSFAEDLTKNYPLEGDSSNDVVESLIYKQVSPEQDVSDDKNNTRWARLPALAFGRTFDVLLAAVGNSGALPNELVSNPEEIDKKHPAAFIPWSNSFMSDLNDGKWDNYKRSYDYLRRRRVGAPWLCTADRIPLSDKEATNKDTTNSGVAALQPVENVSPLAREFPSEVLSAGESASYFYDPAVQQGLLNLSVLAEGDIETLWSLTMDQIFYDSKETNPSTLSVSIKGKVDVQNELKLEIEVIKTKNEIQLKFNEKTTQFSWETFYGLKLSLCRQKENSYVLMVFCRSDNSEWNIIPALNRTLEDLNGIPSTNARVTVSFDNTDAKAVAVFNPPAVQKGAQTYGRREPDKPLALLPHPMLANANTYKFHIAPPVVDLKVWDRWVARDQELDVGQARDIQDRRINVWKEFHTTPGKTLDDPAVEQLYVELLQIYPVRARVASPFFVDVTKNEELLGIQYEQNKPITVVVTRQSNSEFSPTLKADGPITINLPAGAIFELRIYAAVDSKYFKAGSDVRFADFINTEEQRKETNKDTNTEYYLFSPMTMVIESATTEMPTSEALWKALNFEVSDSQIKVLLNKTEKGDKTKVVANVDWVKSINLMRQLWRWQGRQIQEFPAITGANLDSEFGEVFKWDVEGFGTRSADDHVRTSKSIMRSDPKPLLWEQSLEHDPRALYYRFSVNATSRYAGLALLLKDEIKDNGDKLRFPVDSAIRELESRDPSGRKIITYDPWKRYFVPCRWSTADPVPRPKIKMIVPLTQSQFNSAGVAGFLVVTWGAWYEVGGLRETLQADILTVNDISGNSITEYGPDVILSGTAKQPPIVPPIIPLKVNPPIGHTFDTDTEEPLLVASSFILDSPAGAEAWDFAHVRFRRQLKLPNENELYSAYTDPYWVQFLPDSSYVWDTAKQVIDPNLLNFEAMVNDADKHTFQHFALKNESGETKEKVKVDTSPIYPTDVINGRNVWTRYLLLTQIIYDVRGRRNQEQYVGLYQMDKDGNAYPLRSGNYILDASQDYLARLVTVQQRLEKLPRPIVSGSPNTYSPYTMEYYSHVDWDTGNNWEVTLAGIQLKDSAELSLVIPFNDSSNNRISLKIIKDDGVIFISDKKIEFSTDAPFDVRIVLSNKESWQAEVQARFYEDDKKKRILSPDTPWNSIEALTIKSVKLIEASMITVNSTGEVTFLPPTITAEPWDHLFPVEKVGDPDGADAKARIVSVSPPLNGKDASQVGI